MRTRTDKRFNLLIRYCSVGPSNVTKSPQHPHASSSLPPLSYSHGVSDVPLCGSTIGQMLDEIAHTHPNRPAVVSCHQNNISLTYEQLHGEVRQCSNGLWALGLRSGQRLGLMSQNRVEWLVLQYATAMIGVILVCINPSYKDDEVSFVLEQSGCTALIVSSRFGSQDYVAMLQRVIPELSLPRVEERASLEARTSLSSATFPLLRCVIQLTTLERTSSGFVSFHDELMQLSSKENTIQVDEGSTRLQCDSAINIQFTSGTTGKPKGVTLSHHNILNNANFVAQIVGYTCHDVLVLPVPLYHCFGMVMGNLACMTRGACVVYPGPAFSPTSVLEAVQNHKATSLYGVPTMFIDELTSPHFSKYDLSTLRTGLMAGSPCPTDVLEQVKLRMHMKDIGVAYGMTETSPVSTQTRSGTSTALQVSTVGQVHPHVEIKIISENNEMVPIGHVGEFCTRGYSVMLGYWKDRAATSAVIDESRWLHTGDLAKMDSDGFVQIVGRKKDMIIRGGENVYPREVEEVVRQHVSRVKDVQVFGVPDERLGEEVAAWVIRHDETSLCALTEEDIVRVCREKLSRYKVPRYVHFVKEFPLTASGKVKKFLMRDETSLLICCKKLKKM